MAACSVKRHEDWNLVWIKEAEKRVEGRAEWRWLPAELSSCIVGTLSKFLFNQYRGCLPLQLDSVRFPAELCANMEEKVNIEF